MWLVPMLLRRQPAVGVARVVRGHLTAFRSFPLLEPAALHNISSARSLTAAALASGAACTTTQQAQLQAADMVALAAIEAVHVVEASSLQAAEPVNYGSLINTGKVLHAAAALNMQAVAATQAQLEQACYQMQQQEQQQQQHLHLAAGVRGQPAAVQAYRTQLLAINPAELPPAEPPAADLVQQLLSAPVLPELSREACPHLYYILPEHFMQQQQLDSYGLASTGSSSSSSSSSAAALQQAAALLQAGMPVAMPTETVYGLAGNALSGPAVASIFAAKGRPADNPLIVHVSDLDMLAALYPEPQNEQREPSSSNISSSSSRDNSNARSRCIADIIPQQYHRLVAAFWPGPLTILLPASPLLPAAVTAGQPTVAVRMPAHPVARALIAAAGVPLAAPSANTSGRPSPTSAQHVLDDLAGRVPAVVDGGGCGFGVESTVLDGLRVPPVVLRPGGVTAEDLAAAPEMACLQVYARDFRDSALEAAPTTPGMKYRHYSPSAPVLLLDPAPAWQQQQQDSLQEHAQQQQGSSLLQQLVLDATQELLERVQQGQLQDLAAARAGSTALRVVLLSTCGVGIDSKASSSTGSSQELVVGWTADSLASLQAQKQQQHCGEQQQHTPAFAAGSSSADRDGCCNGDSSAAEVEVLEYVLGSWQQPELVAQQLFGALRAADKAGAGLIVVQGLPPAGTGLAVMNRLQKAASRRMAVDL